MAVKLYNEEYVNSIAEAIISKNQSSSKYKISEMAQAIEDLIWMGTQEEYDALPSWPDETLYLIFEETT